MLVPASEPTEAALGRLSPSDRALLELSLRQQVPDDDVASLLRSPSDEVERRRAQLLDELAYDLGLSSREDAAEALLEGWGAPEERRSAVAPAAVPDEPARRLRVPLLVLALAAALVIAYVFISGGEEAAPPPAPVPSAEPAPAPAGTRGWQQLSPVAGSDARAAVRHVERGLLRMRIDQLPEGSYTVWLYSSVAESAPLVRFEGARGTVDVRVPVDAGRYAYLDVSREPGDGNPNHSGESVLRIPTERVLGRP